MTIWLKTPWIKRIELAVKNRKFTNDDIRLSRLWITDPFSELVDIVIFKENQLYLGPSDMNLVIDGIYFSQGIESNDVSLSLNCMKSINKRVLFLYNVEPWKSINELKWKENNT